MRERSFIGASFKANIIPCCAILTNSPAGKSAMHKNQTQETHCYRSKVPRKTCLKKAVSSKKIKNVRRFKMASPINLERVLLGGLRVGRHLATHSINYLSSKSKPTKSVR